MKKRILSVMLALDMLCGMMVLPAAAATEPFHTLKVTDGTAGHMEITIQSTSGNGHNATVGSNSVGVFIVTEEEWETAGGIDSFTAIVGTRAVEKPDIVESLETAGYSTNVAVIQINAHGVDFTADIDIADYAAGIYYVVAYPQQNKHDDAYYQASKFAIDANGDLVELPGESVTTIEAHDATGKFADSGVTNDMSNRYVGSYQGTASIGTLSSGDPADATDLTGVALAVTRSYYDATLEDDVTEWLTKPASNPAGTDWTFETAQPDDPFVLAAAAADFSGAADTSVPWTVTLDAHQKAAYAKTTGGAADFANDEVTYTVYAKVTDDVGSNHSENTFNWGVNAGLNEPNDFMLYEIDNKRPTLDPAAGVTEAAFKLPVSQANDVEIAFSEDLSTILGEGGAAGTAVTDKTATTNVDGLTVTEYASLDDAKSNTSGTSMTVTTDFTVNYTQSIPAARTAATPAKLTIQFAANKLEDGKGYRIAIDKDKIKDVAGNAYNDTDDYAILLEGINKVDLSDALNAWANGQTASGSGDDAVPAVTGVYAAASADDTKNTTPVYDAAAVGLTAVAGTVNLNSTTYLSQDAVNANGAILTALGQTAASFAPAADKFETVKYYTDAACTTETTTVNSGAASNGAAPVNAGDYWMKLSIKSDNAAFSGSAVVPFTVAPKPLTISKLTKEFDGDSDVNTTDLTLAGMLKSNGADVDTITVTAVSGQYYKNDGTTATKNAADAKKAQISAITLGGTYAANYCVKDDDAAALPTAASTGVLTLTSGVSITPKPLTAAKLAGVTEVKRGWDGLTTITKPDAMASVTAAGNPVKYTMGLGIIDTIACGDVVITGVAGNFTAAGAPNDLKNAVGTGYDAVFTAITLDGSDLNSQNFKFVGADGTNPVAADNTLDFGAKGVIEKVVPAFEPSGLTQTAGSVTVVPFKVTPAADPADATAIVHDSTTNTGGNIVVKYEIKNVPTATAADCDCGAGNKLAHSADCALAAATCVATDECLSGHSNTNADCPVTLAVCDCSAAADVAYTVVHQAGCPCRNKDYPATAKCNCGAGNAAAYADHTVPCASFTVGDGWYEWDESIPALGKTAGEVLAATAANGTFKVKAFLKADTTNFKMANTGNAAAEEAAATEYTITVNAPYVPSTGGGSGVSGYTVTYDPGDHGKLASDAKKNETVSRNKAPKNIPEIVADEGFKFLGWTLDGKPVDAAELKITKRITLVASYEAIPVGQHLPYVVGVGDSRFAPEASMSRAEAVTMLSRLTDGFSEAGSYQSSFTDVSAGQWFDRYVGFGVEHDLVLGYGDGTFRPNQGITRAEFAAMVARFMDLEQVSGESMFSDVDAGYWGAGYINAMAQAGIIDGYEDGTFKPDQSIKRAEAVKILNGALERTPASEQIKAQAETYPNPFTDVEQSYWAYYEIMEAALQHAISDFHTAQ